MLAVGLWLIGLAADQVTKLAALANLEPHQSVEVLEPVLRFTLIFNPGAAFGMGEGATVIFAIFAVIATLVCLFVVLPRVKRVWHGIALGLLLAGITGNLVDRMFQPPSFLHGHVIDFIQVPGFAILNVADIFITVGAGLVILGSLLWDDEHGNAKQRKKERV
ncbi:MAG: signal peptidase II [Propionibacterium sp.]|nr:signal peptidase II [Propionibacterium sp.]